MIRKIYPLLALALMVMSSAVIPCYATAVTFTNQPVEGITLSSETTQNPPERFLIARIDLANPRVHLRVAPGGANPDSSSKWPTTLMEPTKVADREKFDFVINGDFFAARGIRDGEGTNSHFHAAQWARTQGVSVTDGKAWSECTNDRPSLVVHTDHTVSIEMRRHFVSGDWEVISGNALLVHNGKAMPHGSVSRNPRTAVGLDASRKQLIVLVADGRKSGLAVGLSYQEMAAEMVQLGCTEALNLDGGGSSVMAVREAGGSMKILNWPTDGHERAVADVLGVSVDPK